MASNDAWQEIGLDMMNGAPTSIVTPGVSGVQPTAPTVIMPDKSSPIAPVGVVQPTTATAFLQSRPGGPIQQETQRMVAVERRISSQLQRKATTSKAGQQALLAVTQDLAAQHKPTTPGPPTPIQKRKASRITSTKTARGPVHKRAKVQAAKVHIDKAKPPTVPACKFGCTHGGLVALQQMQPYDTKHYLGAGKYLHKKTCRDCSTSLVSLFEQSKRKTIFYYCQVDYNMTELTDDECGNADHPCATILCIGCYFARETKKNEGAGTTRRSSTRGRA
jgi:hypothetical protein